MAEGRGYGDQAPLRDLVVIGASAGGVEALRPLAAELPAVVLVVLRLPVGGGRAPRTASWSGPGPCRRWSRPAPPGCARLLAQFPDGRRAPTGTEPP